MKLPSNLIVSCQALEDEPLHSSFIMSKMALAAAQGGAKGIRANSKEDIIEIKKEVSLPIIGIVKRNYQGSDVYITATSKEVDELIESGCEVIAMDATISERPKESLEELVNYAREQAPHVELMADISTIEEAIIAEKLGFDYVGTTLHGYTKHTKGKKLYDQDFAFLKEVLQAVEKPVIAEGNIITPDMLKKSFELGVYATVVGGAITRPKDITSRFVHEIKDML
ncbi:N-acetylmannosamine-6-phosphate 2-epimerase [Oceanobacillus profundus]|uniref:N-acetylmannosamine-6-phosphate 2-epimerase n=1 Tax=Oceanobacillus TaxID=182709 RepID=UPI000BA700F4|nr:N-acetylmannosamine-6-phosphate 2-epimerase [Oceanobacillus profundus]MBR3121238.1 N-acetylmannosamine-6-phosphate 2-epimerase [Oceanobacillus sp.]MDO6451254.1 N-acetylmannosamine-6-phosphate 2-epimerase [Oceanobacillus profundus]PAE30406.1 N-acetylmannosamine-6-phosphate 2-epimerase [Paenibacillus sp. 7884-2]